MPNCRIDIAIRQQVRREGLWTSLLVPRERRPSVPLEERQDLTRKWLESLGAHKEPTPAATKLLDRWKAASDALRAMGRLGNGPSVVPWVSWGFAFDDRPETCFEAVGDYRIERTGIMFLFVTGLPGDLNRFVIERTDLDENHSRLSFERGGCRWELTVGQSIRRNREWVAVPLAPIPPPKR
jgi:hypothetical protein